MKVVQTRRAVLSTSVSVGLAATAHLAYSSRVAAEELIEGTQVALPVPTFSGGLLDAMRSPDEEAFRRRYEAAKPDLSGVTLPRSFVGAKNVAIIFHGSGGPDRETADVATRIAAQDAAAGLSRPVEAFNWMPWFTSDTDRLCFVSRDIGARLGAALAAASPRCRSVHVIGTSAGGFAADAFCNAYVEAMGSRSRAHLRLSLADPFTARDGADWNAGRGAQYFGSGAAELSLDYAGQTRHAHART